jgi:hypothetical protein
MNTATFVRHFLVGEFSGNTDTYWSVYMYKQHGDDKFYFGPVWDFDIAYDNDSRTYPVNANRNDWLYRSGGSTANGASDLVNRIISDPRLYEEIRNTYSHYRDRGVITEETLMEVVDRYVQEIDPSQKLNFKRWNVLDSWVHMINHNTDSYMGEVNIVKKYLKDRLVWMDQKLNYIPHSYEPDPTGLQSADNSSFSDVRFWAEDQTIHIERIKETTFLVIMDWTGRTVYKNTINTPLSVPLRTGVYIIHLSYPDKGSKIYKCLVK